ncbi:MAG: preprotein translocase subunit SecG [bacterium]
MLQVFQIILGILLITVILLQAKGTGLGASFGGGDSYHTKRGAERFLFAGTIIIAVLFILIALFNTIL